MTKNNLTLFFFHFKIQKLLIDNLIIRIVFLDILYSKETY
jgi:hypothetical protein